MSLAALLALAGGCLVASLLVTRAARNWALRQLLLDHPNERSAHTVPTPRLGGLGIMCAFLPAALLLAALEAPRRGWTPMVVVAMAAVVSGLGLVDDVRSLPARWRFAVQLLAACAVVASRGGDLGPALEPLGGFLPHPILAAGSVLWIVWATNFYNFMDGIDGFAGGQTVWAALGIAGAAWAVGNDLVLGLMLVLAAAAAGFLRFNLPPASVFMGDVASTAIGFLLACVPFIPGRGVVPVAAVLLALFLFFLDSTTTLLRRVVQGKRWFEAHRTHLYQRPLACGFSHAATTYTAYAGMAVLAGAAALYPRVGPWARVLLFAGGGAMFLGAWLAVRALEARAIRQRPAPNVR
jgi:UDP-N-acetylmuramyl pentapeptide phosphotransferase/UDP-N-acetylglucosamine-1-phosphate transferase